MKLDRSAHLLVFVAFATGGLGGVTACHVYVDEPARPAPPPPPPPAKPGPPKEVKVATLHAPTPPPGPVPATATGPATCLDTGAAAVGDCAAMQAPSACAAAPTPQQKCQAYRGNFVPKVAAAAVSCMIGLSATQVCDATSISTCARTALAQACPSPAVTQLCQIAVTPCKTTATDCAAVLSGLSDQGQQAVAQCVARGCTSGLSACIDGLATIAKP